MDQLINQIAKCFGIGSIPNPAQLVINDGFDDLEKARAVEFFSNKSWEDVLGGFRLHTATNGGEFYLDELVCLDLEALSYYLRAYFSYSFETLESDDIDDDFLMFLFGAFYQLKYMKKYYLFGDNERGLIVKFTAFVKHHEKIQTIDIDGENFVLDAIKIFENYPSQP